MVTRYITFGLGTPFAKHILELKGISDVTIRIAANVYFKSWCSCLSEQDGKQYAIKHNCEIIHSKVDAETIIAEWGDLIQRSYLESEREKAENQNVR